MPICTEFLRVALGIFNSLLKRYTWPVNTAGSDQSLGGHSARGASTALLPLTLQASRNKVS